MTLADHTATAAAPAVNVAGERELAPADYRARKTALMAAMRAASPTLPGARRELYAMSAMTDDVLRALWHATALGSGCALAAVGGYGRHQMYPHSDVDVLVIEPERASARTHAAAERFIHACWDAGLQIGSGVRTVAESLALAAGDVSVQTALLDARMLAGSRALFQALRARFDAALDPLAFLMAKLLEMRERHQKYGDTPYALEPNCKESPGGLRDLQLIAWAARAAGLGTRWRDLHASGLLTPQELKRLRHNEALLALLRSRLHLVAGRHEDRLVFDLQTSVAQALGIKPQKTASGRIALRVSEVLMRRYYRAAKEITQLRETLLQLIESRLRAARGEPEIAPRMLDADFADRAGLLELRDPDLYQRDPAKILRTFLVYARTPSVKALSAHTLRALADAQGLMGRAFREDPANRACFLAILQQEHGVVGALRLMNETAVLGHYLPPWRRIVGQMQHDLFHAYTVDQHILTVVRNMWRFFSPDYSYEFPLCSRLAAGWDQPWLLVVAALFHDIAKGRGGNHSVLGVGEVRRFCAHHGIARADRELIEFLVHDHLTMSRVAQQEDLSDPQVIADFARAVGDVRRLSGLYLLTVADVRATGPTIWSAWKGRLLATLYDSTAAVLGGWLPSRTALAETRKHDARAALAAHPDHAPAAIDALWAQLGATYFLRTDAAEIAWHTHEILAAQDATAPLVRVQRSDAADVQAMVYLPDQPELFARICAYFEQSSCSILDAHIYTTPHGRALDTFQVDAPVDLLSDPRLLEGLERGLTAALASTHPLPPASLGRVSTQARSFPMRPRIEVSPVEDAERWLLTVTATDRSGVLYSIARSFAAHAISVESAKVMTLGDRVEDVFLLRGATLQDSRQRLQLKAELAALLGPRPTA